MVDPSSHPRRSNFAAVISTSHSGQNLGISVGVEVRGGLQLGAAPSSGGLGGDVGIIPRAHKVDPDGAPSTEPHWRRASHIF